jgi:hypothetical protein
MEWQRRRQLDTEKEEDDFETQNEKKQTKD